MRLLQITFALLLCSGLCPAQTTTQPQNPAPPAQPQPQAAGQTGQPPDGDAKKEIQTEDIGAGYKRVAGQKKDAWLKLEQETLPAVDQLGKSNSCANGRVIANRIEAVRAAAREFTTAYRKYLTTWSEYTIKDIEESKKFWADMDARKTDLPGSIKSEEDTLKEYQRKRANLAADDQATREIYDDIIAKSTRKIEELRSGAVFAEGIDRNTKLSQEYWDMKLETIKKDEQVLAATQQNYENRYDAIIQQWRTECTSRTKPSTLDDLNMKKK